MFLYLYLSISAMHVQFLKLRSVLRCGFLGEEATADGRPGQDRMVDLDHLLRNSPQLCLTTEAI